MSCCGGECSCGKGNKTPAEESVHLVQLPASQGKLSGYDWGSGLKNLAVEEEIVEVRFKNMRKGFFKNRFGLELLRDDRIVVETDGGHDVGTVTLTGSTAAKQFDIKIESTNRSGLLRVYRKATGVDLENWLKAKREERDVLLESRKIASNMGLEMSISDVEFRSDGQEVSIFYTAGEGVDYRELVQKYASAFRVKVEMRQKESQVAYN